MRVVVLMGGVSREREISLRSGRAVARALRGKGHDVHEIDAEQENLCGELTGSRPGAVFIALHGRFGEDGCLQGMLEWLRIPYTGSSPFTSSLCFNKLFTKRWLEREGVITPSYDVCRRSDDPEDWLKSRKIPVPAIIKPNEEGSSFGIFRVFEKEELAGAIRKGVAFDSTILVEEYIDGREVTVGVLNGHALPVVEVVPKEGVYDYEAKYTPGKTDYKVPASLSEKESTVLRALSEKIANSLLCEGAVRVDYIWSKKGIPYFLEVNTIPGMTETSLLPKAAGCEGVGFEELCDLILQSARLKVSG